MKKWLWFPNNLLWIFSFLCVMSSCLGPYKKFSFSKSVWTGTEKKRSGAVYRVQTPFGEDVWKLTDQGEVVGNHASWLVSASDLQENFQADDEKFLDFIAPFQSCSWERIDENLWRCLEKTDDFLSQKDISSLISAQKRIYKLYKAPYLLSRKVYWTTALYRALRKKSSQETFCHLLKASSPKELPLWFRSKPWEKALCSHDKEFFSLIGYPALRASIGEVHHLLSLAERKTHLGILKTHFLPQDFKDKSLWVELSPKGQQFLTQDWLSLPSIKVDPTILWVFDPDLWHTFQSIFPMKEELPVLLSSSNFSLESYLLETLKGEMSFFLPFPQGRRLRLLKSHYSWAIKSLGLGQGSALSSSSPLAKGSLLWDGSLRSQLVWSKDEHAPHRLPALANKS